MIQATTKRLADMLGLQVGPVPASLATDSREKVVHARWQRCHAGVKTAAALEDKQKKQLKRVKLAESVLVLVPPSRKARVKVSNQFWN